MLRIDLDTSDYDVKIDFFRNGIRELPGAAVLGATNIIERNMRDNVPVKTGKLRDSIEKTVFGTQGVVSTTSGYGLFVDENTKPHIIRGKPLLRFFWKGKWRIRHWVQHPGTTGQQFRRKTLIASQPEILSEIAHIYNQKVLS